MSILKKFKERSNKTAKTKGLPGGVHKNVELTDFAKDVESSGSIKRYLLLKFKQYDDENNPVGEFSSSYMQLDPTSRYIDLNVKSLLVQTQNLAEALFGDAWIKEYDPLKGLIDDETDATYAQLTAKLEKRPFVVALEKNIKDGVETFVEKYLEENNGSRFVLKLVYNDKGYVGFPRGKFIQNEKDKKIYLTLTESEKSLIKKFKK